MSDRVNNTAGAPDVDLEDVEHAYDLLFDDNNFRPRPDFRWLYIPNTRIAILSELGRLRNWFGDAVCQSSARQVCKLRMSNRATLRHLVAIDEREWRLAGFHLRSPRPLTPSMAVTSKAKFDL